MPARPQATRNDTLAQLEDQVADARDRHLQERFGWILGVLIVFDAYVFTKMQAWTGPLVLLVLELVLLIVVARACGVEDVVQLVTQLVHRLGEKAAKEADK